MAHALGTTRLGLYVHHDRPLTPEERDRARSLIAQRARRIPVAHLLGQREFFALPFEVTPAVLTPRPETELLVETLLSRERAGRLPPGPILEIGTGSGCVAVTLAKMMPSRALVATDLSPAALAVARRNSQRHGVAERVALVEGDLAAGQRGPFAAVVSNPPYVAESERDRLEPEVRAEPPEAIFGGPDGLAVIRRIVAAAPPLLTPGGMLLLEVGAGQAAEVMRLMREAGLVEVATHRDLAGIERTVRGIARERRLIDLSTG